MFPSQVVFDLKQFQSDVVQALEMPSEMREQSILKRAGLRLVIQLKRTDDRDRLSATVRDLFPQFQVSRLFEPAENDRLETQDDGVMRNFFLATLQGVSFRDIRQSPFDLAYHLASQIDAVSVEPSLPYIRLWDQLEEKQPNVDLTTNDKAWALRQIRAPGAWAKMASSGDAASIGHLDTGWSDHIDLDRAALDFQRAVDLVDLGGNAKDPLIHKALRNPGHGTKTGSVIVSRGDVTDGGEGTSGPGKITGVARKATLVPVRCIESVVVLFSDQVATGIYKATKLGCEVLSMSLGGRPMSCLREAMLFAGSRNVIPVCAAGNVFPWVVWPATYPQAIAVAATNCFEEPWPSTASGSRVDISAPGENVWVAKPSNFDMYEIEQGSGTSYSTAYVAGVAALWLQHFGRDFLLNLAKENGLSLVDLFRAEMKGTCIKKPWSDTNYGAGIINAEALISSNHQAAKDAKSQARYDSKAILKSHLSSGWRWGHAHSARIARVMGDQAHRFAFENEILNGLVDRWGFFGADQTQAAIPVTETEDLMSELQPHQVRFSQTLRQTALWNS